MSKHSKRKLLRAMIRRRTKPGASPGTLAPDPESPHPQISVLAYDDARTAEKQISRVDALDEYLAKWPVTWVNVDGLGDAATLERIGQKFGLHRLALEDVVNVHQRAKVEAYPEHLFIVVRMIDQENGRLTTEQFSIFLGANFVLTFQERPGDCLDTVRERIRLSRGRIRTVGADYLAYAIIDAIIDSYFPAVERYSERIDELEEEVMKSPSPKTVSKIHDARGELLHMRRAIWPHREAMAALAREESPLISHETRIYLRDCYDHTIQIIDLLEAGRDMCADLRDYYLSQISNRMNEIMKVLTIIATIFIPLSFIASVYGMNFNTEVSPWNMPELNTRYGYPVVMGFMGAVGAGLLVFFYRRGWLGRN